MVVVLESVVVIVDVCINILKTITLCKRYFSFFLCVIFAIWMVIDCVMIQKLKVGGHWCTYLTNRARQVQLPIDLDTPGEHVPSLLRLDPSVLFIYLGWRSAYTLLATTTLQINQCELNDNE